MNNKPQPVLRIFAIILYIAGVAAGSILAVYSAWGDLEASTFDSFVRTDETLTTFNCPVFIGKEENTTISADIPNTIDRDVSPFVRIRITQGFASLIREEQEKLDIPQGETAYIEWEISAEDAAYKQVVMARVYQLSYYSLPSRQAACGVVVVPVTNLTGQQFFMVLFVFSLLSSAAGLALLAAGMPKDFDSKVKRLSPYIYLAVCVLAVTLLTLLGKWLVSVALMVVLVVSLLAVASYALIGK